MKFLRTQWFSAAIIGLFILAWLAPELAQAINPRGWTKLAAIVVIFFVSGLALRTEESIRALGARRLHLFIQTISLLLIPALCWLIVWPLADTLPEGLVIGLYLLAVTPTTVTSCVVFTQLAGGNTAGALLNALIGNMLGVFVSPAVLMLMLDASGLAIDLDPAGVFLLLCSIVLLPFLVGQALHAAVARSRPGLTRASGHINRACILLIIFMAFGEVFVYGGGGDVPWGEVVVPLVLLLPAHLLLLGGCAAGARLAGFNRGDRIAILFCAPQKTIALGLPLAAGVLAQRPELLGLASLPLVVYHALQLLVAGLLEPRLRLPVTPAEQPAPEAAT